VIVFELRADAERYAAGLLQADGSSSRAAPFRVESVRPRNVFVFAIKNGCTSSFNPAGAHLSLPEGEGGRLTSAERQWSPGRGRSSVLYVKCR